MRKRPLAWMSHGVIQVLENLCWSSPVQKANEVVKTSALCTSEQQQLWQIKTVANQGIVHLIVRTNLDLKSSPVQKANEVVKTSALCTSEQQQLWQIKTVANQGIVHLIVRTNLDLKLDLLACIHARPNKAAAKRLLDSWCRSSKSLSA